MDARSDTRAKKSASEIIRAFGGPTKLSRLLGGIRQNAVSNWGQRGFIPESWHLRLVLLARELGVDVIEDDFVSPESLASTAGEGEERRAS